MHSVILEELRKEYSNVTAVDNLSLNVPQGSVYGFIGPNGSGKTTTLRMIMNIIRPDSGDIRVFGQELRRSSTDRIGYMPEERGIYTRMKVGEVLEFYGDLKNGKNLKAEVRRWLEKLELADWENKKVETLSKGMTQKIQFISTVIAKPDLIILDEPFSGLDPVNRDVIKDAILELQAQGSTVIFSTHDMNVAENMCDYIFMIFKGQKVLDGVLSDIQKTYGSDTVRIRTEAGKQALEGLDGRISAINDFGRMQEMRLKKGSDPQEILAAVMNKTRVLGFEVVTPSLHDIFKRIARPDKEENNAQ